MTSPDRPQSRMEEFNTADPSGDYEYVEADAIDFLTDIQTDVIFDEFTKDDRANKAILGSNTTVRPPLPFIDLIIFYDSAKEVVVFQQEIAGPLYDFTNTLVGQMTANTEAVDIEGAISRVTPKSSPFSVSAFVIDESGLLITASGHSADTIISTVRYPHLDPRESESWPDPPSSQCMFEPVPVDNGNNDMVMLICTRKPDQFDADPVIQAAAPYLESLCSESIITVMDNMTDADVAKTPNPSLGQPQTVMLEVDDSQSNKNTNMVQKAYTIVCDRIDIAARGMRLIPPEVQALRVGLVRPPKLYDSWRVITIISEKEIVDPFLGDFESKSVIVGVIGVCVAAALCIIAAAISILLLRKNGVTLFPPAETQSKPNGCG